MVIAVLGWMEGIYIYDKKKDIFLSALIINYSGTFIKK